MRGSASFGVSRESNETVEKDNGPHGRWVAREDGSLQLEIGKRCMGLRLNLSRVR